MQSDCPRLNGRLNIIRSINSLQLTHKMSRTSKVINSVQRTSKFFSENIKKNSPEFGQFRMFLQIIQNERFHLQSRFDPGIGLSSDGGKRQTVETWILSKENVRNVNTKSTFNVWVKRY